MVINVDELTGLVDALVPFTQHMLKEHGAFVPLGAIVKSGDVVIAAAALDSPASTAQDMLEELKSTLRHHAASPACAAVAWCADAKVSYLRNGDVSDAILLRFEHRSGEALDVVIPYRKKDDDVEFARPMIRLAAGGIFETTGDSPGIQ